MEKTMDERVETIRKIVNMAVEYGVPVMHVYTDHMVILFEEIDRLRAAVERLEKAEEAHGRCGCVMHAVALDE
jgi:sugar phosphate isomerase/epimerase